MAVTVAILMVVLLGMLALGSDFGFLYAARRNMVNANDAASLAAAQSCAKGEGQGVADAQADALADANRSDAFAIDAPEYLTLDGAPGSCDAPEGKVRVHYGVDQELYFAPVVGFDSPVGISARATAMWGALGSADNIMPFGLCIDQVGSGVTCPRPPGSIGACTIPDTVEGTECFFYVDNDVTGDDNWGTLNLLTDPAHPSWGWDVPVTHNGGNCNTDQDVDPISWVLNGPPGPVAVNFPEPTWVCRIPGRTGGTPGVNGGSDAGCSPPGICGPFDALWERIGDELLFPVVHRDGLDDQGNLVSPPVQYHRYNVVGFVRLMVTNVVRGNEGGKCWRGEPGCAIPQAGTPCSAWYPTFDANSWCLRTTWLGYTTEPGDTGGDNFGVIAVSLEG